MNIKIKMILFLLFLTIKSNAQLKDSLGIILNSNSLEFISSKSKVNSSKADFYVLLRNDSLVKLSSLKDTIKIDPEKVGTETGNLFRSLKERQSFNFNNSRSYYYMLIRMFTSRPQIGCVAVF